MKKFIVLTTSGCVPHNTDSLLIKKYFTINGWQKSRMIDNSDIIIINTCAFIQKMEDLSIKNIQKASKNKKKDAKIIVVGCLSAINKDRLHRSFKGDIISANSLHQLDNILKMNIKLHEIQCLDTPKKFSEDLLQSYPLRIGWGCNGVCSYCSVKRVFGKPHSRSINAIIKEYNAAYDDGHRQFRLVATDTGSYGEDIGLSIIDLLRELKIKHEDCTFALSHLTPKKVEELFSSLNPLIKTGKIAFMNIPVQSGSDRILSLMKRDYKVEAFKSCITKILQCNKNIFIKTDIIAGFPTETDEEFMETVDLVEWLSRHNITFQCLAYSQRPGTEAFKMPGQIPSAIKEERVNKLNKLCDFSYALRKDAKGLLSKKQLYSRKT